MPSLTELPTTTIVAYMVAEPTPTGDETQPSDEILNTLKTLNATVKSEPQTDTLPPAPVSEYDVLNNQLKENPRNPEGWRRLIDWVENSGDTEKLRAAFDTLLQIYPNTVCDTTPHQAISCFF